MFHSRARVQSVYFIRATEMRAQVAAGGRDGGIPTHTFGINSPPVFASGSDDPGRRVNWRAFRKANKFKFILC
jgi:hypothetical protein